MKFYLVRHAQSVGNAEHKLISFHGGELTDIGKIQAARVSLHFKRLNIKCIYTSPSPRCVETAECINAELNTIVIPSEYLMERKLGAYDNLSIKELETLRRNRKHKYLDVTQDWHDIDEVEQDEEIFKRFESFLKVDPFKPNDAIVIVTHAGFIKSILSELLSIDKNRKCILKIPYCGVTFLEFLDYRWMLRCFSFTDVFGG